MENNKIEEKKERVFRKRLTIDILNDLNMSMYEFSKIKDPTKLSPDKMIAYINAFIISGDKLKGNEDIVEIAEIIVEIASSLMKGHGKEMPSEIKEKVLQTLSEIQQSTQ